MRPSCSGRRAIAHWVGGNVDFELAGNILVGSIPGVLVGGRLAVKSGKKLLRGTLAVVLIASGTTLITKGDGEVVVDDRGDRLARSSASIFTYILRREVKMPHGEGVAVVKASSLISTPWSRRNGDPPGSDPPD